MYNTIMTKQCSAAKNDSTHKCAGLVRPVIIYDPEADYRWGRWNYCRNAANEDKENGLLVIGYNDNDEPLDEQYKLVRYAVKQRLGRQNAIWRFVEA